MLRHESLLHDIIQGRIWGKATRGRKRLHLLSDLMKGKSVALRRTAEDRKEWQKLKKAGSHTPASQHTKFDPHRRKGVGTGAHKNVKICPKLWFLATGSRHNEHIQMKFGL